MTTAHSGFEIRVCGVNDCTLPFGSSITSFRIVLTFLLCLNKLASAFSMAGRSCTLNLPFVMLAVFVWLPLSSLAQSTNLSVSPVPDWVRLCDWTIPTNRPATKKSEGTRYLLYERQEIPEHKDSFTRVVLLMENETGVQDSGSIRIRFDPSF